MKKDDIIHFFDLLLQEDSYHKKIIILKGLYLFIKKDYPKYLDLDIDNRRKILLRESNLKTEGGSYFIKDSKTENIYFPKFNEDIENLLQMIDNDISNLMSEFLKMVIDDDYDFV